MRSQETTPKACRQAEAGDNEHLSAEDRALLDRIGRAAYDNLRAHSNCCRSTLIALQTHLDLPGSSAVQASFALAGGIGGTGETCGAVVGALMALGLSVGCDDPTHVDAQQEARGLARSFVARFRGQYGSTRCHDLQKTLVGWVCDEASKEEAWQAAGGPIACASLCSEAATHAAVLILRATRLP